jgi:hypothetical protein
MAYERSYVREDLSRWVVRQREVRPDILPLSFEEKGRFLKAHTAGSPPSRSWRRRSVPLARGSSLGRSSA